MVRRDLGFGWGIERGIGWRLESRGRTFTQDMGRRVILCKREEERIEKEKKDGRDDGRRRMKGD